MNNQKPSAKQHLQHGAKFIPYAFALSFASLLVKALASAAANKQIIDYVFWGLLIIFGITSVLYLLARRETGNSTNINIAVEGDAKGSNLIGIDGPVKGPSAIDMKMKGNVEKSTVTGRRQ